MRRDTPKSANGSTVRSLAASVKTPVCEVLRRLQAAGMPVRHPSNRLSTAQLHSAREALGLRGRGEKPPAATRLTDEELVVQCLRPLREKGKVGRNHTSPIQHVWGHGVPDHQKEQARELVESLLMEGMLKEKQSQGRRHVWLTQQGLAHLSATEHRRRGAGV